jgi:hypothetical protein
METIKQTMEMTNLALTDNSRLLQIIFYQMNVIKGLREEILAPPIGLGWQNEKLLKPLNKQ